MFVAILYVIVCCPCVCCVYVHVCVCVCVCVSLFVVRCHVEPLAPGQTDPRPSVVCVIACCLLWWFVVGLARHWMMPSSSRGHEYSKA